MKRAWNSYQGQSQQLMNPKVAKQRSLIQFAKIAIQAIDFFETNEMQGLKEKT